MSMPWIFTDVKGQVYSAESPSFARRHSVEAILLSSGTRISEDLSLAQSLAVLVQNNEDGCWFRSDWINEDGFGSTFEAAYMDFVTSLRDRYHSLLDREDRLSAEDREVLTNLRSLLAETRA